VISFMTLAELDSWADIRGWGTARREDLRTFLSHYVVQYPDRNLCQLWGSVLATARRAGLPFDSADAWIAATALLYGAPLVTDNTPDFAGVAGITFLK